MLSTCPSVSVEMAPPRVGRQDVSVIRRPGSPPIRTCSILFTRQPRTTQSGALQFHLPRRDRLCAKARVEVAIGSEQQGQCLSTEVGGLLAPTESFTTTGELRPAPSNAAHRTTGAGPRAARR